MALIHRRGITKETQAYFRNGLRGGPQSAIVALAGSASEKALSVIYAISKDRETDIEWVHVRQNHIPTKEGLIMDNIHGAKIVEAIALGCVDAKIEDRRPEVQFKYSNDKLRGIARPVPRAAAEIAGGQQAAGMEDDTPPRPPVRKGPDFNI